MKTPLDLLIKKSAKKSFSILRERSPFWCTSLKNNVSITKKLFNHIAYHQKRTRKVLEILERLLIIPFVEDIVKKGEIIETRDNAHKISLNISHYSFSVIVIEEKNSFHVLSCFQDFFHKRKGPS